MKWKMKFAFTAVFLITLAVFMVCTVTASAVSAAEIKITFVNKTDRTVSVALLDSVAVIHTKGWWNVEPGKSRTVTIDIIQVSAAETSVGYYAMAKKEGANTWYWRNHTGEWQTSWWAGYIHPTESFDQNQSEGIAKELVGFRAIKTGWEFNGDTATRTVNLVNLAR